MKKVDMLILTKHMYTMTGEGVGYLADHGVAVDGGKIAAVAPRPSAMICRTRCGRSCSGSTRRRRSSMLRTRC